MRRNRCPVENTRRDHVPALLSWQPAGYATAAQVYGIEAVDEGILGFLLNAIHGVFESCGLESV